MHSFKLTYKQFGERAIVIEWPESIDQAILENRVNFEKLIREQAISEFSNTIEDIVPAYHSLTIIYSQAISKFSNKVQLFKMLYQQLQQYKTLQSTLFSIPVCYEDEFAEDIELLSKRLKIKVEDVITLHTEAVYRIYFIGFLPGFLYLGGLNKNLHFSRKAIPNLQVKQGSVAIGGKQTGIYPQASPGGWHVIGNTPIEFFKPKSQSPCFAYANDQIKFYSITVKEYKHIQAEVARGTYQIKRDYINA